MTRRLARVQESAATQERAVQVAEAHATGVLEAAGADGTLPILLIDAGWGSSGYYSSTVLEDAAGARIFPAGTHMYLDHPGLTEQADRPVRSVRDLVAVLSEDATYDAGKHGLVARAQVFGPWADGLAEMRDAIGISIRADAYIEMGEAEGRRGPIVSELVRAESVDFVTHAGRGGRILGVLESARPGRVVAAAVQRGVAEATANDTREALQSALRERFTGDRVYVWVRDFDAANVWCSVETPDSDATYQLAYSMSDTQATLEGEPIEVLARTEYVPVTPAGQSTSTTESQGGTMPEIAEAELARLREADAGRVAAEEARVAAEARAAEAEATAARVAAENAVRDARDAARPIAAEVFAASESLPASTVARLTEAAVQAATVGEAGFDQAAFRAAAEAQRTTAETELAEALAAAGVGNVTGNGTRTSAAASEARQRADEARRKAFGRPVQKGA